MAKVGSMADWWDWVSGPFTIVEVEADKSWPFQKWMVDADGELDSCRSLILEEVA